MKKYVLSLSLLPMAVSIHAEDPPSVLLIMCDQMTPFLMGTYGHEEVKTPNLDRLAAEGILFRNTYSPNPICAPARASFLTSKYSSRIGVYDNAAVLDADEPTIAHYFSHEGYETILSGKMHVIGPDQLHGFEQRYLPNIYPTDFEWTKNRFDKVPRSHARSYQGESIRIIPEGVDLEKDKEGDLHIRPARLSELMDLGAVQTGFNESSHNSQFDRVAHTKALEFIRARGHAPEGTERPFFLFVSYNYPHEPFHPPRELWDFYEGVDIDLPEWPEDLEACWSPMDRWLNRHHGLNQYEIKDKESMLKVRRAYYALVTYVDLMVGELLDELQKAGLDKNTIVIFTSDHGEMLGEKGMVQKRSFYEWSSRVPLIFRMPDRSNAGKAVHEPVSLIDILPTLMELTGMEHETTRYMDGESLVGLMNGTKKRNSPVFSETPSEGVFAPCFMVRKGDLKYIYMHGFGAQLFDLSEDPGEWNNLSGRFEYAQVENELHQLILKQFDPAAVDRDLTKSLQNRLLIRDVMDEQGTNWDYQPEKTEQQ